MDLVKIIPKFKAGWTRLLLTASLTLWLGIFSVAIAAAEDTNAPVAATADTTAYNNWITLGAGGPWVSGDHAQFKARQQIPDQGFGGLEEIHLEQTLGKQGVFVITGRGIYDNNDNAASILLSQPDKGYVRFSHKQFRTWYDGSGGFFPGGGTNWFSLFDEELHVDRSEDSIEAGLTIPNWPLITVRYTHEIRKGMKDSTEWGDANVAGAPGLYPASTTSVIREFVPTFLSINERRDIVSLDLKHTIGNTTFGLGGRYEHLDNDDAREIHRRPGETTGATPTLRADRYVTDREMLKEDLFNVHAFTETVFNNRFKVTVGGSYNTADTDSGGTRIYGDQYDPIFATTYGNSQARDTGWISLGGGANVKEYVGNVNLMFSPLTNLFIVPSFKVSDEKVIGSAGFYPTTVNVAGGPVVTSPFQINTSDRDTLEVTEALDARYTGIRNWVFYSGAQWGETCQNMSDFENGVADQVDWRRFTQKYSAGANWYPRQHLNLGGQYYYKTSDNSWDDAGLITHRDFATHDINFRINWHPLSTLGFVTRYDFQLATVHNQGASNTFALGDVEAANITSHIISESINWTPIPRMYWQLNGSFAWDGAVATGAATQTGDTNMVPNLKNGYWTASALCSFVLDDQTDLQLQYSYYRADNYINNYVWSQPFGTTTEEHSVTATISRQFNKALRGSLKYGYFLKNDPTSGGFNNYAAHLVYATLQYRF